MNKYHAIFKVMLLAIVTATCLAFGYPATGRFYIQGTRMIDPQGDEFIPVGANMNGLGWVWDGHPHTAAIVNAVINGWKFNILRLNNVIGCGSLGSFGPGPFQNLDLNLDEVVNTYTSKGVVVMFEDHGVPANATELECAATWYKNAALKYKNNPYVWYNPFNEPSDLGAASWAPLVAKYRRIITAIRDEAGADNIIIADGASAGQDQISGWGSCGYVQTSNSAILTYGDTLSKFNGKTYPNVGFSFHSYGAGGCATETENNAILKDYITKIHNKGLFLMVGETGSTGNNWDNSWGRGAIATLKTAPYEGVGVLAWHGQPGDGFCLTWNGNSCGVETIDNLTNPTRQPGADQGTGLTPLGVLFWDLTHKYGFGLGSKPTDASDAGLMISPLDRIGVTIKSQKMTFTLPMPGSKKVLIMNMLGRTLAQGTTTGQSLSLLLPNSRTGLVLVKVQIMGKQLQPFIQRL